MDNHKKYKKIIRDTKLEPKEKIKKILDAEFKEQERIWAMQPFYSKSSVIDIIAYFVGF